jgi:hypothetical protein
MGKLLELALEILFFYMLYKLVVEFIIPIFQSTRQVHRNMQEMQHRMQEFQQQQYRRQEELKRQAQAKQAADAAQQKPKGDIEGEYIDYEEVK